MSVSGPRKWHIYSPSGPRNWTIFSVSGSRNKKINPIPVQIDFYCRYRSQDSNWPLFKLVLFVFSEESAKNDSGSDTENSCQIMGPEIDKICQFLGPEILSPRNWFIFWLTFTLILQWTSNKLSINYISINIFFYIFPTWNTLYLNFVCFWW